MREWRAPIQRTPGFDKNRAPGRDRKDHRAPARSGRAGPRKIRAPTQKAPGSDIESGGPRFRERRLLIQKAAGPDTGPRHRERPALTERNHWARHRERRAPDAESAETRYKERRDPIQTALGRDTESPGPRQWPRRRKQEESWARPKEYQGPRERAPGKTPRPQTDPDKESERAQDLTQARHRECRARTQSAWREGGRGA